VRASSGCPNVLEGSVVGPYVVVGLCRHPEAMGCVVETCRVSLHHYGGWGVYTKGVVTFDTCCAKMVTVGCSHVTCSVFARGASCALGQV